MARNEKSTTILNADGVRETYRLLEFITIDDILLNRAQALAAEIKTGKNMGMDVPRSVKDYLIRTQQGQS